MLEDKNPWMNTSATASENQWIAKKKMLNELMGVVKKELRGFCGAVCQPQSHPDLKLQNRHNHDGKSTNQSTDESQREFPACVNFG